MLRSDYTQISRNLCRRECLRQRRQPRPRRRGPRAARNQAHRRGTDDDVDTLHQPCVLLPSQPALEAIQAQAGHRCIESTRIYLHLANDWLAGEYRRAVEAIDAQAFEVP